MICTVIIPLGFFKTNFTQLVLTKVITLSQNIQISGSNCYCQISICSGMEGFVQVKWSWVHESARFQLL